MNIEVTKNEVKILESSDLPNENEYKITTCYFTFDEFTSSFQVKRAIFTILSTGEMYEIDIINDECDIPVEVLRKEYERVKIGVYGYNIGENEELLNRFSPSYDEFIVPTGSYEEGALSPEPITPSQYDMYSQALQEGLNEVDNKLDEVVETVDDKLQEVDNTVSQKISEMDQKIDETDETITRAERLNIEASKSGSVTTVTITKQDGTTESEDILDGEDGTDGENGIGLQYDWSGTSLGVKREDEALFTYVNLEGKKGDPGAINLLIVNELPLVGSEDTLYFVPKEDTEESDMYDEYVWINNDWELVGTKQITVDLSDYVKNTDYASSSKGGVIKSSNDYATQITQNGNLQSQTKSYSDYQNAYNSMFIGKGTLENVITGKGLTTKAYVDDTIEANNIDVQINESSIVSDNVANISVTGSYSVSPLLSLWDVTIDGSIPLGANEDSININTTSGNYDGTSVLLATNDTLESEYVPIAADVTMQGTNYSSSINNVGYQIEFGLTNNTSGDSNSIVLTPTETYIGNVRDPENDGDAVNKLYVDNLVGDIESILTTLDVGGGV